MGDIGAVGVGEYRPPPFLAKVVGKGAADELHQLLMRLKSANDEHAGDSLRRVMVLLNGDSEVLEVREALRRWAERYVAARLARKHPRDQGDPVRTFFRLYDELVPWLDVLAYRMPVDTLHPLYLDEVCDYVPWLLFRGTWAPQLTMTPAPGGYALAWGTVDPRLQPLCLELVQLYSWGNDPSFRELVAALETVAVPDDVVARRAGLASDLAEMRPLLVRNFKPERTVMQLAPEAFVAFTWNTGHRIGTIVGADSERELLTGVSTGITKWMVHIHPDGTIRDANLRWRQLDEVPGGLAASWRILEAVHARLFSFYDRIDLAATMRGALEPDATEASVDEPADAVVAAACEVLRRRDTEPSARLGVRTTQLLSMLERLGCEVRQGKGSEISLYRPGGRIWTLGHHKRNARIGWAYVRQVLKRLGISTADWSAAVG